MCAVFVFIATPVVAEDHRGPATIIAEDLRTAAETAASEGNTDALAETHRRLALFYELEGNFEGAANAYDAAYAHSGRSMELVRAGMMYVELGDYDTAAARVRQAAEAWNGDREDMEELALLATRLNDLADAGFGPHPGVDIDVPEDSLSDRLAYILYGNSRTAGSPEAFLSASDPADTGPFESMPTPWNLAYGAPTPSGPDADAEAAADDRTLEDGAGKDAIGTGGGDAQGSAEPEENTDEATGADPDDAAAITEEVVEDEVRRGGDPDDTATSTPEAAEDETRRGDDRENAASTANGEVSADDDGPTGIQVGSFVVEANAADLVETLRGKDFVATIVLGRETGEGGRYHRVVVPLSGSAAVSNRGSRGAQELMTALREAGHEGYFFFADLAE